MRVIETQRSWPQ
uniref:Truncated envelope glycoprotein n=1 Tax=Human immunodeficiency virus type 1 TaxID=11676 RepID=A0A0H3YC62_HV1|nr:truncated envelope glycoprotein [Human immunodeficiency virus 1]